MICSVIASHKTAERVTTEPVALAGGAGRFCPSPPRQGGHGGRSRPLRYVLTSGGTEARMRMRSDCCCRPMAARCNSFSSGVAALRWPLLFRAAGRSPATAGKRRSRHIRFTWDLCPALRRGREEADTVAPVTNVVPCGVIISDAAGVRVAGPAREAQEGR